MNGTRRGAGVREAVRRGNNAGGNRSGRGSSGNGWSGRGLGLPESGPGSLAPWSRRLLALFIDWGIALLISATWFQGDAIVTLAVFAGMRIVLVGLLGVSIGKRLVRIQVVRGTRAPGPLWAALNTVLLLLVIPPLLLDGEGRGAHDRAAGTVQLRM